MSKFVLGKVFVTPGIINSPIPIKHTAESLARHLSGDWGTVCDEDKRANDAALLSGDRVLSTYEYMNVNATTGDTIVVKYWIITEADRSATTILLPEEY